MNFTKVKLIDYNLKENHLILKCSVIETNTTINFIVLIENGSIQLKIKTFSGDKVSMNYLECGDILHIKSEDIKEIKYLEMYPNIKLAKKIKINSKYELNSESSYDDLIDLI